MRWETLNMNAGDQLNSRIHYRKVQHQAHAAVLVIAMAACSPGHAAEPKHSVPSKTAEQRETRLRVVAQDALWPVPALGAVHAQRWLLLTFLMAPAPAAFAVVLTEDTACALGANRSKRSGCYGWCGLPCAAEHQTIHCQLCQSH